MLAWCGVLVVRGKANSRSIAAAWPAIFVGVFFTLAELIYLAALSYPEASVGIASLLRRGSMITSIVASVAFFRDFNYARDIPAALSFGIAVAVLATGFF